jgi:hypothetical protein
MSTKFRGSRKHARVYHGRDKGTTETHIPNDQTREGYDQVEWESSVPVKCDKCGLLSRVHKLELKIWKCPCER